MKRDNKGNLISTKTDNYDFRVHKADRNYQIKLDICAYYEVHELYTDKMNKITALKFIKNSSVPIIGLMEDGKYIFKSMYDEIGVFSEISQQIQNSYDLSYNCHGYTFLDGLYWIDEKKEIDKILSDDEHTLTNERNSSVDFILIHENEGNYEHSAIFKYIEKRYYSKNGINFINSSVDYDGVVVPGQYSKEIMIYMK